jgi:Protein of unknown function (DUF3300)
MKTKLHRSIFNKYSAKSLIAVLIVALLVFSNLAVFAQSGQDPQATSAPAQQTQEVPKIPNDQLDSLVAPIALYPDPLLSQVLVASTYPLEVIQLQQWLHMKGQYMDETLRVAEVQKQDWDPSIQAMVLLPETVKQLSANIKWTQDLGNAFLAQQGDVMDAVQRMRTKAMDAGKLKSNEQMKVETKEVEGKDIVVIEQSSPEVIYVPTYDPAIIWGTAGYYPYPPIYYPPYSGLIAFGVGIAIGIAWGGGGWGWGFGWGNNDININRNNNFVSHYNRNNINRGDRVNPLGSGNKWQHNPKHRGGAPYANKDIANRFSGAGRGDSISNRPSNTRGSGNRATQGGSMGGERIGSRDVSRSPSQRNSGSFGNGGSWGGGAARTSSSRGSSSMGGGGFGRGGGGMRGGGMRGGGRR